MPEETTSQIPIPNKVFIVPYRNRPEQKLFFTQYMKIILEHSPKNDYEIYFSHQADERTFNRGAMKNIGFLAIKEKYPNHYEDMNFIFHDLDTVPFHRIFDYETQHGVVKHYYGFDHSLGGIVVIKGVDFEAVNGYPNYWSWGLEDACLQKRCLAAEIQIDRSQFYKIGSPQILHIFDGVSRIINQRDPKRYNKDNGEIGLSSLRKIAYTIEGKSSNEKDNIYQAVDDIIKYINIRSFQSETRFDDDPYFNYDLREPVDSILNPDPENHTTDVVPNTDEWTNIPFVPTAQDKKEILQAQRQVQTQRQEQMQVQKPVTQPQPQVQSQVQSTSFKVHTKTIRVSPQQAQQNVWSRNQSVPMNTMQQKIQPPVQFQGGYRPPIQKSGVSQITPYQYKQMNPKNANVSPVKVLNSRLRR